MRRYFMSLDRNQWKKHIKSWKQSKISQKVYCEKNSLNYSTLKYWVCRINKERKNKKQQSGFIEIPLKKTPLQSEITITLQNGIQIKTFPDIDPDNICRLITVLRGLK
jgi:hypothetical protein